MEAIAPSRDDTSGPSSGLSTTTSTGKSTSEISLPVDSGLCTSGAYVAVAVDVDGTSSPIDVSVALLAFFFFFFRDSCVTSGRKLGCDVAFGFKFSKW